MESYGNNITERLLIRPAIFEDCKYFYEWEMNDEVSKYFSIPENQDYNTVVKEFVLNEQNPETEQYTIIRNDTNIPIGRIHLGSISRKLDSLEIYRIYIGDPTLRNQGYGREALKWCLDRAFKYDTFHRVYLDYYSGNDNAAHLYESMGFNHIGLARGACKKNGKYYDVNLMDIIREDYLK